ncbi:MAG TPA: Co2+/Mg2+ efflux protein ApaG [Flavipsychrobacter sp.]|jgi:ApaG protein|nr:Co2+/Mg2+ efflux protein ApaG [Flavipsychrobacter sp.]
MVQLKSYGICVAVEVFYQEEQSRPVLSEYLFAYRITIENQSRAPIKLLKRKWNIIESSGITRIVEGDGVVGEQPIIVPGNKYQYVSAANLKSDIGKMFGHYLVLDLLEKKELKISIPEFKLIAPFKQN